MRYVKILLFFLLANISNAEVKYEKGKVIFIMEAPEANKVVVTGTFLNWNPQGIEMEKRDGSWFARIELKPGEYEYKFIVDGTWV
ncbi:MAG: glycogen-binding domain-containing protein, partial [Candidatus Hydrothermae bacterium]|nr:glycogen-binding domain-containing protein [Candidatus Hydrothermae bacterium]